jgi:hypothetical protein
MPAIVSAASGAIIVCHHDQQPQEIQFGSKEALTRPLMIPRPRVRRGDALPEVGLEVSLMPSAALGIESLPPILEFARQPNVEVAMFPCMHNDTIRNVLKLVVEWRDR